MKQLDVLILYFILIFLFNGINILAISKDINPSKTATSTVDSLFSLAKQYVSIDNEVAQLYTKQGSQILENISYRKGELNCYMIQARIAYYEDRYQDALLFLDSVKSTINFNADFEELSKYYSLLALVDGCMGNYEKALEYNYNAIAIHTKTNNIEGLSSCNNFIGNIYLAQDDLKSAEEYFQLALKQNKETSNARAYGNILICIGKLKEKQDSLEVTLDLYNQAYDIFVKSGDIRRIALSLLRQSEANIALGYYTHSKNKLIEAEEIYQKLDEKYGLIMVFLTMSELYLKQNDYTKAISYGKKANALAIEINSQPLVAETYLQLSSVYRITHDFEKALFNFESYEKLNTELISWENNKKFSNLEFQLKLLEKEKNITILSQKNKLQKIQLVFILCFLVIIVLFAFGLTYILRIKNKNLRQKYTISEEQNRVVEIENKMYEQSKQILENDLELKNKELASKALALLQLNETLRNLASKINDGKGDKDSMKRIVQEIHMATHSNIWDDFNHAFNKVYNRFYEKLFDICPNLSSTEIKIAALLKLNLSTKEIAAISFKTESAIKTVRHRLRNKLNLNQDESLISFLLRL